MIRFSSTLSSRSLVIACGMTPIERRTPSACLTTSKPLTRAEPAVGGSSVVEHSDERGLAGAVGPEQPEDLTVFDREADAVDGREVAELLDELVDLDRGRSSQWQQHVRGHPDREATVALSTAGGPRTS